MDLRKGKHAVFTSMIGTLILIALLLLLDGVSGVAQAESDEGALGRSLFVVPDGTGSACSQANPCALQTALSQAKESDAIYVAQGTYTGVGDAVIIITESIALYGGWDRGTAAPPVCDPARHPATLDGEGARRVIYVAEGTSPTIDG